MKKILLIVFSNLHTDARMIRHLGFIARSYDITACSFAAPAETDYKTFIIKNKKLTFFRRAVVAALLLLRRYSWAYSILFPFKNQFAQLKNQRFDLIIANDIETLPLAFNLKDKNTRILFDAHEYAPKHFEDKLWWRIFFMDFNTFLCKKYIPKTDAMITVGQAIANEYEKNFGKKPQVITNATHYRDLSPVKNESGTIRLVHHGIVGPSRKIENIINIMQFLPAQFTLDLVLLLPQGASTQTLKYLAELKNLRPNDNRIKFLEPVPVSQVVTMLQRYDMGIILAPPINFNYANGLPNKLFDFIQGRIGVLSGPTPEIANIIREFNVGIVADDFTPESYAKALMNLTLTDFEVFKENANKASRKLSAEKNEEIFSKIVVELTTQRN